MHLDANNLYGWAMSGKLPINGFKWVKKLSKFNESFMKNYDENSDRGYFLEVDVDYPKYLFKSHKDLPFLAERKELINTHKYISFLPKSKKLEKVEQLVCRINDKEKYVVHIRALKQALNHSLKLKEVHRVIQFNQRAWLKNTSIRNTKSKTKAKN